MLVQLANAMHKLAYRIHPQQWYVKPSNETSIKVTVDSGDAELALDRLRDKAAALSVLIANMPKLPRVRNKKREGEA